MKKNRKKNRQYKPLKRATLFVLVLTFYGVLSQDTTGILEIHAGVSNCLKNS